MVKHHIYCSLNELNNYVYCLLRRKEKEKREIENGKRKEEGRKRQEKSRKNKGKQKKGTKVVHFFSS